MCGMVANPRRRLACRQENDRLAYNKHHQELARAQTTTGTFDKENEFEEQIGTTS